MAGPLTDIDLKLLSIFACVVRHGGFAAADSELKIGGPAISRHMAELESRLGFRLCDRGRGGFSLTERGKQVHEATVSTIAQMEDFRSELAAIRDRITGTLNIGIVDGMILDDRFRLRRAIGDLRRLSDDVHATIQVMSPHEIERQIDDGRLHVGILARHNTVAMLDYVPLQTERLMLYCGRDHPLANVPDTEIDLATVRAHAYVDRGFTFQPGPAGPTFGGRHAATATQMEGIAFFILSGAYLGHLPDYYVRPWIETGGMRAVGGERFAYDVQISAATRKRRHRPLALEAFLASLTRDGAVDHA